MEALNNPATPAPQHKITANSCYGKKFCIAPTACGALFGAGSFFSCGHLPVTHNAACYIATGSAFTASGCGCGVCLSSAYCIYEIYDTKIQDRTITRQPETTPELLQMPPSYEYCQQHPEQFTTLESAPDNQSWSFYQA